MHPIDLITRAMSHAEFKTPAIAATTLEMLGEMRRDLIFVNYDHSVEVEDKMEKLDAAINEYINTPYDDEDEENGDEVIEAVLPEAKETEYDIDEDVLDDEEEIDEETVEEEDDLLGGDDEDDELDEDDDIIDEDEDDLIDEDEDDEDETVDEGEDEDVGEREEDKPV